MQYKTQILKYCLQENLKTYDPYDIWKTKLGFWVKNGFNKNKYMFMLPAAAFTIFDIFINNKTRSFYKKQEYPVVRAFAVLSLVNLYKKEQKQEYLNFAKKHIEWLLQNKSQYKNGFGWGIGFKWNISGNIYFTENTPLSTHTPYGLEALYEFYKLNNFKSIKNNIFNDIFDFFEKDINILYEKDNSYAISYGPFGDIIVNNATSYALFSYSIFYNLFPEKKDYIKNKIIKFSNFLKITQQEDGSWYYAPFEKSTFIDCFHSAIILKNIIKAQKNIDFDLNFNSSIEKGYKYLKEAFFVEKFQLFKRFSISNKPSITKFDLYDNAEMLNLVILMNDTELIKILLESINKNFVTQKGIYSVIDLFGIKRNKNTLRWAVMPYLYSLSKL